MGYSITVRILDKNASPDQIKDQVENAVARITGAKPVVIIRSGPSSR
jgi:hypothetical protein